MRILVGRSSATCLIAWSLAALAVVQLTAQERKGAVTGAVTDAAHAVLQGARVELTPVALTTVSNVEGAFTISNLDPGAYKITISYLGLAPFSADVTVRAGETVRVDAELKVASVSDSITVTAERPRGEAAAINRELTADNIVQVLPAEVITSLPNTNIADAVGRLPSVSLERDEGEGKYIQVREMDPRLTNVTINGVNVPSPEGWTRTIKLDAMPADLVESIEVNKTLSANQDADGIGGSVNLVTRTASDTPTLILEGIGGYNPILNGRYSHVFDGTVGQRFGKDKKLGVIFSGSYDYNDRGINDVEPGPAVLGAEDLREYAYNRTRFGFGGSTDYRLGPASSIYLKGLFSDFRDYGDDWVYTPTINTFITPTQGDSSGSVAYREYLRRPDFHILSISTGGVHNIGPTTINYEFAVSRSWTNPDGFPTTYFNGPQNVQFGLDLSNPYRPKFPVQNGINIYDPSLYTMSQVEVIKAQHSEQLNLQGGASVGRSYRVGSHNGTFEAGFKVRNGHKTQFTNDAYYNVADGVSLPMSQFLGNMTDPNYYGGSYKMGPLTNYHKIESFFAANPGNFVFDANTSHSRSDRNNYDTTERVIAEYLMNTLELGHFRLQTGLRVETTQEDFTGYHVLFVNNNYVSTSPVPGHGNYTNFLPSVQLSYRIGGNTQIRAAYGMGVARPNFGDLAPYVVESQSQSRKSVSAGNPNLKATRANNFDFLVERYLQPLGLIQAGFFYKDLTDPIYSSTTLLTSGNYAGYRQSQPINGPNAHIEGFEAAWQQRLSFLPGFLNGTGVAANYSYTSSEATVPGRTDKPALVRQGPHNWNVGMTYDKGRFTMRLGVQHNDAYIYSYNWDGNTDPFNFQDGSGGGLHGPNGDVYLYAHTQVDIQGGYRFPHGVQLIVSGLNLNNEVFGFYQGSPIFPIQREYYRPTISVGFRWTPLVRESN
jgi:TonB-dependent receptor